MAGAHHFVGQTAHAASACTPTPGRVVVSWSRTQHNTTLAAGASGGGRLVGRPRASSPAGPAAHYGVRPWMDPGRAPARSEIPRACMMWVGIRVRDGRLYALLKSECVLARSVDTPASPAAAAAVVRQHLVPRFGGGVTHQRTSVWWAWSWTGVFWSFLLPSCWCGLLDPPRTKWHEREPNAADAGDLSAKNSCSVSV
jgi:hypothetical protein